MPHPADPQPVFRALADPTRRAIIAMLADKPKTIGAIAASFEMSRPAVAKHLKILEEGDVIRVVAKGRERINSLNPDALRSAAQWLAVFDRFWDDRLARLKMEVEKKR
ncbi:MAG: ArsR/SmtB family transcription factor [Parvularculaceae bacterium]